MSKRNHLQLTTESTCGATLTPDGAVHWLKMGYGLYVTSPYLRRPCTCKLVPAQHGLVFRVKELAVGRYPTLSVLFTEAGVRDMLHEVRGVFDGDFIGQLAA